MKKILIIFSTVFLFLSCSQEYNSERYEELIAIDSEVGIELSNQVEKLCELTGLKLVEPNYRCLKIREWGYTVYYCKPSLKLSDIAVPYSILLDKNKRLVEFMPLKSFFKKSAKNNSEDIISPSDNERKQVLDACERVNAKIGNRYFGSGKVYKWDNYYNAIFLALSQEEIDKGIGEYGPTLDPYFTYYLTKDMKVYGVRCGGWCYPQMEKD